MHTASVYRYEFGLYRIDPIEQILYRHQEALHLSPKLVETLLFLLENSGRVIAKEEFQTHLWPDTFVEEINLARNISLLRKTLSEGAAGEQFIETIPKRGYRFLAPVKKVQLPTPQITLQVAPPSQMSEPAEVAPSVHNEPTLPAVETLAPASKSQTAVRGRMRLILIPTVLLLGLLGLAVVSGSLFQSTERAARSIKSLAVLPLKITGAGPETEYIGFGLTDMLITRLGALRQFAIRPTSAITKYAESDVQAAGRALQVEAVVTGHAYLVGSRIRVSVQLVSVSSNQITWSGTFDGEVTNLFTVQDEMATQLASVLTQQKNPGAGAALAQRRSSDPQAQTNYLKGRYFEDRREWQKAFQFYQAATQADPQFAPAWVGMARGYCFGAGGISHPLQYMPKAKECALRALQLDEGLADAHSVLATVLENYDWDWQGAEAEYRKAVALPNSTAAHFGYAECMAFQGRFNEAIVEVQRVLESDPLSLAVSSNIATIHYYARQYDQAIEWSQKTLELNPRHAVAYLMLGAIYEKKGMQQESIAARLKAKELSGEAPETIATLKRAMAESGWAGYWRKELEIAQAQRTKDYYPAYVIATIYARLGEKETAKQMLHEAFAERALMTALKIDPILDEVRADPEIRALIVKIGLNPDPAHRLMQSSTE